MTYPGTKIREQTALESSLIAQVTALEKERDELVRALRQYAIRAPQIEALLEKYEKQGDAHDLERD